MSKYSENLKQVIDEWNKDPITDERIFSKFRAINISVMTASEAFHVIGITLDFLVSHSDQSTRTELLQTMIDLAKKSDTTEIPIDIAGKIDLLQSAIIDSDNYTKDKLGEFLRHYRILN